MSAIPLDQPCNMPTVVSRLPKFGFRTKSVSPSNGTQTGAAAITTTCTTSTSTRLTNGFYHHPSPEGVNTSLSAPPASVKQNGFIRVPMPLSMKWSKESETGEDSGSERDREVRSGKGGSVGQNRSVNKVQQNYLQRQQGSTVMSQRDTKNPNPSFAAKGNGFSAPVTSLSTNSQSTPKTLPLPKSGSISSKPRQTAFGLITGTKQPLNAVSGSKLFNGTNGSLRQPQNFSRSIVSRQGSGPLWSSRSGSPLRKKQQANRSHSSDSLGSAPSSRLTESDRFRSRSLTQVRRQPSPTLTTSCNSSTISRNPTVTRSYSINRAKGEELKELTAASPAAPPRDNLAKMSVTSKTLEGGGRDAGAKVQSSAVPRRSGFIIPSLLPPSALKKPLLPSPGLPSKHSGISYKLSRPSLNKLSRPLRVTPANVSEGALGVKQEPIGRRNSADTPPTENSPEMPPVSPETKALTAGAVSQGGVSIVLETLEDMSLSSSSSLDKIDTSQEYMDDFDNFGNGMMDILLVSSKNDEEDSGLDQSCARFDDDRLTVSGFNKSAGLCFLDDGIDWPSMRLSGEQGEHQLSRLPKGQSSSQSDYHEQGGSSLELSPSDSCGSGGTYMWDEEGLEPLGGTTASASININTNSNTTHHIGSFDSDLNSIDLLNNLDSSDLDDDDLMLDADVIEDASLHSDGDGISHMAQWRRRQLCWGTQDLQDNESDLPCYKITEDPGNKRTETTGDRDLIQKLCPTRSPCLSPGSPGTPDTPCLALDVEDLAEDCSTVKSQLEFLQKILLQEEEVDDDTLTTDILLSPEANDSSGSSDTEVQALLLEVQHLREELRSRDQTIAQLNLRLSVQPATTRCGCHEMKGRMDRHTQTSVTERDSVASQTPTREHTPQILLSSSRDDQGPLTDRSPTPPPIQASLLLLHPCSTQLDTPAGGTLDCPDPPTEEVKDCERLRKEEDKGKARQGGDNRSLRRPQPSKLGLFLPQSSSASAAAAQPKTRSPNVTSRTMATMSASTSCSSRLPKPKSP